MRSCLLFLLINLISLTNVPLIAQGLNHVWLHGEINITDSVTTHPKAKILYTQSSTTVVGEQRILPVSGTQATICNKNGDFLFASNGCFIMDASEDTMQNGGGLNPGLFANSYCSNTTGLPMSGANLIIPYPGDSSKYVLFHQVGNYISQLNSTELFYSVIDMNLNAGLGGVVPGQKNIVAFTGNISWGISACKHGNGRDWWIVAFEDNSNLIYKLLFTSAGIYSVSSQNVNMPAPSYGNAGQPCFSPDGTKLAYKQGLLGAQAFHDVRVFSFDRCTGQLDSIGYTIRNNEFGFGLSFSPNSQYLYYSSGGKIYQLDCNSSNIGATDTTVAVYDGYCYPTPFNCTAFWLMYLAANGKIYITSSQYVIDLNYIDFPDLPDTSCGVRQHALRMPCYTSRDGVNHPNYYLGADTASLCDTLGVGLAEIHHDFHFSVSPNPSTNGIVKMIYLLPQNQSGELVVCNSTGQEVYHQHLPPWSTLQYPDMSELAGGVYVCMIKSGSSQVVKKLVITKNK